MFHQRAERRSVGADDHRFAGVLFQHPVQCRQIAGLHLPQALALFQREIKIGPLCLGKGGEVLQPSVAHLAFPEISIGHDGQRSSLG